MFPKKKWFYDCPIIYLFYAKQLLLGVFSFNKILSGQKMSYQNVTLIALNQFFLSRGAILA
jgi:hypothetical protein